jgi:hypothetical protein
MFSTDWNPAKSWSVWGQQPQPEVFLPPQDMQVIVDGWNQAHS